MLYMHDVWVNWFEGEENGYNVCHYHEWRKEDAIEILEQAPLLYITTELFNFIENDMHNLPEPLLDTIYRKSYTRKGQERQILDYSCIVTDGQNILAIDTIGYQIPIRKSRLIPRQEQLVYNMIEDREAESFKFTRPLHEKEYHILSMAPNYIVGLTRRERQLKQLLMIVLDQLKSAEHLEELRYWLTEWDPKNYPSIRSMAKIDVWEALYTEMKQGWSSFHEEILAKMVKGQPFLEKMWELEQDEEQNTLY